MHVDIVMLISLLNIVAGACLKTRHKFDRFERMKLIMQIYYLNQNNWFILPLSMIWP